MKKTVQGIQYNSSLHTFITDHKIAYDTKVYDDIGTYIQENLWKHMDDDWVKKVVVILDDPTQEYGNDKDMIKQLLKHFLPTVRKLLNINNKNPLKNHIETDIRKNGLIDRLIKQRLHLYQETKIKSGLITQVLQDTPNKKYIDMTKPHKKLVVDEIPQTQKTIIANILTLMILEDELKNKKTGFPT